MELATFGVTLVTTIALLVLGKRNISESDVFPSQNRVQPVLVKVRTQDRRNQRSR